MLETPDDGVKILCNLFVRLGCIAKSTLALMSLVLCFKELSCWDSA